VTEDAAVPGRVTSAADRKTPTTDRDLDVALVHARDFDLDDVGVVEVEDLGDETQQLVL